MLRKHCITTRGTDNFDSFLFRASIENDFEIGLGGGDLAKIGVGKAKIWALHAPGLIPRTNRGH